jgi:hypothetical protein
MAKKTSKSKPRNAAPHRSRSRASSRRNAGTRPEGSTAAVRVAQAALGGAITAGAGTLLTAVGGANPETTAWVLTAVGLGLSLKGDGEAARNVGTSMMVASGTQLGLMFYEKSRRRTVTAERVALRPSNANDVQPEMVRAALERARMRLALEQEASGPREWDGDTAQYAA